MSSKRKLSEYNIFFKKHRQNGKSMKKISELWNAPTIIDREKEEKRIQKIINKIDNVELYFLSIKGKGVIFSIKEKL